MNRKKAIKQLKMLEKDSAKIRLAAEGWGSEWKTLVAIIISARTRDETTIKVAEKLFTKFPTFAALTTANAVEISAIIRPVNFFRNKTRNVIRAAKTLVERFGGKVPHDIDKLIIIPGVGRKTANVFLSEVGKDAIGVDTHVSYIAQKLGWSKNENPRKIEQDLSKLFPRKYWRAINQTCVRFGKTYQSRKKKDEELEKIKERTE